MIKYKSYKEYLKSTEWASIRIDLFENRGKKCERCESKHNLHVHHKTYKRIFQEEPEDLEILCKKCHELEHNVEKGKKKISVKQRLISKVRKKKRKSKHKKKINFQKHLQNQKKCI